MPIRRLPEKPDLEHFKKQAKRLLAAHASHDAEAETRFAQSHPRPPSIAKLADAQLVLAREHGFCSWPALVHHLRLDETHQRLHDVARFLSALPDARSKRTLLQGLGQEVDALRTAHRARDPLVIALLRHARWQRGQTREDSVEDLFASELSLDRAQHAIARWHDFASWADVVAHGNGEIDPQFEAAADAIVDGDADSLRALLLERPELARSRSAFAHRATLLHYLAANGVESSRQWQTPLNAAELATTLLRAGAEPDATSGLYGGGSTTMTLLVRRCTLHERAFRCRWWIR